MPLFEYCDTFRKEGERVDRFPTPKFQEHAKERQTTEESEIAWGDLASICVTMPNISAAVKLREGVIKPGEKKARPLTKKKESVIEEVKENLSEEDAKLRWYAPAASPMPVLNSEAEAKVAAAQARLKAVEDKLKVAQAKLAKKKDVEPEVVKEVEVKQEPTLVESPTPTDVAEPVQESKPEEITLKSVNMDLSSYAPHCVLIFFTLLVQRVLEPADASMLTFGSWFQCTGLLALFATILTSSSVEGLRASTFERLGAAAMLRLVAAGAGYFPAGEYEDLYLLGDAGTLFICAAIITLMHTAYKSSCATDMDSYDRSSVVMMCVGFACAVHGDLSDSVVLDIIWMTSLCAESVALLPQAEAMVRGCKSMPMTCVAGMIASRACVFAFWLEAATELRIVVAGCVVAAHLVQLVLSCSLVTGRILSLIKRDVSDLSSPM